MQMTSLAKPTTPLLTLACRRLGLQLNATKWVELALGQPMLGNCGPLFIAIPCREAACPCSVSSSVCFLIRSLALLGAQVSPTSP